VHCYAGRSRSATVVIAWLMRTRHLSMDDAFALVRSKRELVHPNVGFVSQLRDYERRIRNSHEGAAHDRPTDA
jgi:protein-tyrosine phosphatase